MAVVMHMDWDGVTPDQYESLRRTVNWEGDPAPGGRLHVATFTDSGIRVVDVWETAEDFNTFVETRLMPEVGKLGVTTQPRVEITPLHAMWQSEGATASV